jgi:hypothetical protein
MSRLKFLLLCKLYLSVLSNLNKLTLASIWKTRKVLEVASLNKEVSLVKWKTSQKQLLRAPWRPWIKKERQIKLLQLTSSWSPLLLSPSNSNSTSSSVKWLNILIMLLETKTSKPNSTRYLLWEECSELLLKELDAISTINQAKLWKSYHTASKLKTFVLCLQLSELLEAL